MTPRFHHLPHHFLWPSLLMLLAVAGCRPAPGNGPMAASDAPNVSPNTHTKSHRHHKTTSATTTSTTSNSNEGNLLLGNPSGAAKDEANFLLQRPQYSMSFNHPNGGPNWVAWHSDASNLGSMERGKFAPDPDLPPDWQVRPGDYTGSGYDRGHVCPSGDRTNARKDNNATFYMSNMLPQTRQLNRHVWADLENYLRDQIRAGNEVYEVAGGAGSAGKIDGGKINVPEICWKVAVILPIGQNDLSRINAQTRVVTVGIPNVADPRLETGDWRSYLTTTAKIEAATKLNFFSMLPANVQTALKAKTDAGA